MARRSRGRNRGSTGRRQYLFRVGAGVATVLGISVAARATGAYTSITGGRTSGVDTAPPGESIVGVEPQGTVKKGSRDPLVELSNNHSEDITTLTVTLDDCSQGTLYDPEGDSGCSVTFTLLEGLSDWVDIKADVTGPISFSITVDAPNLDLTTTGSVEAVAGNKPGAVDIRSPSKDQDFEAYPNDDKFEIATIDVRDNDGDSDLDRIEIEITKSGAGGELIATRTISPIPGDRYAPTGQPDVVITQSEFEDPTYDLVQSEVYNLDFKAYDADGNFASASIDDNPGA